ncbi:MAG: ABC transporter permease [Egibacteraceae bacterium]
MSATDVSAPTAKQEEGAQQEELSQRRLVRHIVFPLLVAAALGLLYLYIRSQELDSIEQRLLDSDGIRTAVLEHISISLWTALFTLAVAIPLGVALTRPWAHRITPFVIGMANVGQGVPAVGTIVVMFLLFFRDGSKATIAGLVVYCLLPVLRGTMVGLQQVDEDTVKAARGMGMSKRAVLWRIELPLSIPIMLTGVRTALVLAVSTAVLAAFVGGGGIGRLLTGGFAQTRPNVVYVGSVLAAALAVLADWLGGLAEDYLRPKGL